MRCKACDKPLTESEVVWNKDLEQWEICSTCLEIALDAAYSDGFSPNNDPVEGEAGFVPPLNETLEADTYRSYYDHSDAATSYRPSEDE